MSAENLLSVVASTPAVPGATAAASVVSEGDASAFGGLLAEVVAEADAVSSQDLKAQVDVAQTVPAILLPVFPPLVVEAEIKVEPTVLPAQEPTPAPDFTALLKTAGEPQILQGPGAAAPDTKASAPSPEVLPADVANQPTATAGTAATATQPPAEVAAVAAVVAGMIPPPVRHAPERTTPQAPTDKTVSKTSGEDIDKPPVLPGPEGEGPLPPPPVEPRVGPARPRNGLTMKTDGATPVLDRTAPTPADPVITDPVTTDAVLKLESGAASISREAGLSSLSRATIETTTQLAAQITRKLEGRSTRFEMALTPEGLGRVDISLDIDADGQLAARLAFDNPIAAMDLRGRVDELRRQLEDQGFKLAEDALQFTDRDPQSRGDGFDGRRERAFARSNRLNDDADLEISAPVAGRWMSLSLTPDRVDLKV